MSLHPGDFFDVYSILARLRPGYFGTFYLGYDAAEDRIVAIKESNDHVEAQQVLRSQAELLARIQHIGLPQVYGSFTSDDGRFCIVLEHIPGDSLERVFSRGDRPPINTAVTWIIQILELLSALQMDHQTVIQPYLTLDHIYIHSITGWAYLFDPCDVVNPAVATPTALEASGSASNFVQAVPSQEFLSSTVYAVGRCLYSLLTAMQPPEQQNQAQLPPLHRYNSRIGGALEQVVLRALDRDPSRRYPHAQALLAALREALVAQQGIGDVAGVQPEPTHLPVQIKPQAVQIVLAPLRQHRERPRLTHRTVQSWQNGYSRQRSRKTAYPEHMLDSRPGEVNHVQPWVNQLPEYSLSFALECLWLNYAVQSVGLVLLLVCSFILFVWAKDAVAISIVIMLFGVFPLVILGLVTIRNIRAYGWHWSNATSWMKFIECAAYGTFMALVVNSIPGSQLMPIFASIGIVIGNIFIGILIGVLAAGDLPKHDRRF